MYPGASNTYVRSIAETERDRYRSTTMAKQQEVAASSMLAAVALLVATFASIPTSTDRLFSVAVVVNFFFLLCKLHACTYSECLIYLPAAIYSELK